MITREHTRKILVGGVQIGNGAPVSIQSMTNADTRDIKAVTGQIARLMDAGCEIVRVAVPDMEAAEALSEITKKIKLPLVADIHFDYRLALSALERGISKLRINPGNIGGTDRVKAVAKLAKERGVPVRIGVNGGSLEKDLLDRHGLTAEALVESAARHIKMLEDCDFGDICVSLKASSVPLTVQACRMFAGRFDYPLHVGITEAGTAYSSSIKSSVGIGAVLASGVGDTVRVSMTGDPVEEVRCAREILKALELRRFGIRFVSCPTCGRTQLDMIRIAEEVERACSQLDSDIKVAVMGCAVNGPGEAADADIGVACGKSDALLFKKGKIIRKIPEAEIASGLIAEIKRLIQEWQ